MFTGEGRWCGGVYIALVKHATTSSTKSVAEKKGNTQQQ